MPDSDPAGRRAASPWAMPFAAWKQVAIRAIKEATEDSIGLASAGVAFYAFLALVPLLGAVVLTYGLLADPQTVMRNMATVTTVLPEQVAKVIGDQLMNVVATSGSKKGFGLAIALGVALFGARNAAGAIVQALNIAYEEEEKRGFIVVTLLALGMTAVAVVAFVVALLSIAMIGYLANVLPGASGLLGVLTKIATYLGLVVGAAIGSGLLYRYAPSRDQPKWLWLTPGSLLFALAWALLTLGFGFYASRFGNYGATYGSLSAVVVLITWLYLSSYALLFGAELNCEAEHQTVRDTTAGPDRPLGQRGAWAADHVARGADDAGAERDDSGPKLGNPAAARSARSHDEPPPDLSGASRSERRHHIVNELEHLRAPGEQPENESERSS